MVDNACSPCQNQAMPRTYSSIFKPDLFADQLIVVTGGGSGIGRCTAHELCHLGARVVIIGRTQDKLDAVAAEIRETGGEVDTRVLDIREEERVKETVRSIIDEHGHIAGLVNNAGGQFPAPLVSISQKGFETVVRTNLVGGFLMAREVFLRSMQRRCVGSIVNLVADFWHGMPGMGHSGAARAGMDNFTKTAAVEWAAWGVRINAVAPGWVASSGLDHYEGPVRAIIPRLRDGVPLKRLASEAEVSAGICFLLSEAASFITGVTLPIDGGAPLATSIWPLPDHDKSRSFEGFHLAAKPKVLG
jgi:citronellol/citronellal dehydrogenase